MVHNRALTAAAVLTLAAAAFQIALGFVPRWSALFGAPEALVARRALLLLSSLIVACLLGVCAAYGLSGAGYIRRLPLLRTVLVGAGIVFLLRGSVLVPLLLGSAGMLNAPESVAGSALGSSAAFLLLAILYLGGTALSWRALHPKAPALR
jgi:hypothetical protein